MKHCTCLDDEHLSQYTLGLLSGDIVVNAEAHLESCSTCCSRLRQLDSLTDSFVAMLRSPGSPDTLRFLNEPEYQAIRNAIVRPQVLTSERRMERSGTFESSSATPLNSGETSPALRRLGQYELFEEIGRGGMGTVYRARHVRLNLIVALKLLSEKATQNARALRRFEVEMQAIGRLNHENIIRALDAGEADGCHFLVMEYLRGTDIAALLKQRGNFLLSDAAEVIRQAASGLQHIHQNGMVHRDLKPANLFLTRQGQVKIVDLGLALLQDTTDGNHIGLTSPGKLMGTIDYMSPEQAEDTHDVDIRADIYSLGATLYALLCGNAPLRGKRDSSLMELLASIASGVFTPVRTVRPDIPEEFGNIVHRMLAAKPSDRFQTPAEVSEAMLPFCRPATLIDLAGMVPEP